MGETLKPGGGRRSPRRGNERSNNPSDLERRPPHGLGRREIGAGRPPPRGFAAPAPPTLESGAPRPLPGRSHVARGVAPPVSRSGVLHGW